MRIEVLRSVGGIGDLITAAPALRALRRRFPNDDIVLHAPRTLEPLRDVLGLEIEIEHSESKVIEPLRRDCDVAVNMHGRGPESHRALLAGNPGQLIAFRHDEVTESSDGPVWQQHEYEPRRWCRLLRHYSIEADETDIGLHLSRRIGTDPDVVLVHPGASAAVRRWPPTRWVEVVRNETRAGRTVLVTGSETEREVALQIAERAGIAETRVVAGATTVEDLVHLVASAGRVISGDTGIAHIAFALRVPTVTVYGPVPPAEWGPPPGSRRHLALWAGRLGDTEAGSVDAGLLAITSDDVIAASKNLDSILEEETRRAAS